MRRFRDPAVLVFIASLVGSLAVHLPTYVSLGWLARHFADKAEEVSRERAASETEVTYFELPESPEEEPEPERDEPRSPEPDPEEREEARETPTEQAKAPEPEPEAAPEPEPEAEAESKAPEPPPTPRAAEHAIIQKSQNPDVEPPPDTRYVADEDSHVEEETVAAVTNTVRDDAQPELAASDEAEGAEDDPGADSIDELGGVRDVDGKERRPPVEATAPERRADRRRPERSAGDKRERAGDVVIDDGFGTFVVRRGADHEGEEGEGGRARRRSSVDLRMGYAQFEGVVGADVLAEERERYAEERRSRRRGTNHAEEFREFRSSIENFVSNVKVGNQTALSARRSPFAAYIQRVHLRFHESFHRLVDSLPGDAAHTDPSLIARLEIVLEADGTLVDVGVVRSSGQILFDHAAYSAVKRGAPYPAAPGAIKSNDGRVYIQWDFRRDPMACHQLQARPFILEGLPAPGDRPASAKPSTGLGTRGRAPSP